MHLLGLPVLAQVEFLPKDGQEAWPWVAGLLALGGGYLGKRILDDKDKQREELREDLKTCTTELGKTTESLRGMNDVAERQRTSTAEGFASIANKITEETAPIKSSIQEILNIIAPRRRESS